ncbi:DUF1566 domain-containing protein [Epilithonimonas xixisoli]|nr:DUF1566 domain-containing protein [Epilithonimonas xixisoli]
MKSIKILSLFIQIILFLFVISCSNSDDENSETNVTVTLPKIITLKAENIHSTGAELGGNITDNGNGQIIKYGICWGTSDNPTISSNNIKEYYNNLTGLFSFNLSNELEPNKIYYVRAYCENAKGLQYGNTVSFKTDEILNIINPTNILATEVELRASINQENSTSSLVGFVYSKNPNPTINDNFVSKTVIGSASYDLTAVNLTKDTTYYVRACKKNSSGGYYYSEQKQFKTTGYFGPAGGYVAYDKGETTNGWRYLEIHPTSLKYYSNTNGASWGEVKYISGTVTDFGKGLENTQIIVNNTSQADCAAKLCYNLTRNGYSDWFLASSEEMLVISNSLYKANINIGDYAWTSTQNTSQYSYSTNFKNQQTGFELFGYYSKILNLNVFPVRRY